MLNIVNLDFGVGVGCGCVVSHFLEGNKMFKIVLDSDTQQFKSTFKAFKGFDKNLKCRDFQFEIGQSFIHDGEVKACSSGFHSCENPIEVFGYYEPRVSRYCVVIASGDISRNDDDSKIASRKITISAEIGIPEIIRATIEYVTSRCDETKINYSDADNSASSSTGDKSASSSIGDKSASSNTGYNSASSSAGYNSASLSTGSYSSSEIIITDKPQHAVAISIGYKSKSRAPVGSAIVCVYRNTDGELMKIKAGIVGENDIKPNVWYELSESGEFMEAPE
jgi:hypothetical protein